MSSRQTSKRHLVGTAALIVRAAVVSVSAARGAATGFNQTGAGPCDYNAATNWVEGIINGIRDTPLALAADQTVTFDRDTILATGLEIRYAGRRNWTLKGTGGDRAVTLGGDILTFNAPAGWAGRITASPVRLRKTGGTLLHRG